MQCLQTDAVRAQLPEYAQIAIDVLRSGGRQAFVVGGFVRDVLMGRDPHDVDITTDALWYRTRDLFIEAGYQVLETGVAHGTVTVLIGSNPVEITTFRTDGTYSDHRRPDSVKFVTNVVEDLARRDFTVNALAWNDEKGIVDPFGGLQDMKGGVLRAVGDPHIRFSEDALRIMRAVRFSSQLGFAIEPHTAAAIHELAADVDAVSVERVAQEYEKTVLGAYAVQALRAYPDVVSRAVPEIGRMVGFDQHSRWHCFDVWEHCLHAFELIPSDSPAVLKHATLLHDIGKPASFTLGVDGNGHFYGHEEEGARIVRQAFTRLRYNASDVRIMEYLVRNHDRPIDPSPRGIRRALARCSSVVAGDPSAARELFGWLLALKRADTLAHAERATHRRLRDLQQVEAAFEVEMASDTAFCLKDLAVSGSDLIEWGVPAGPAVGRVLKALLAEVIDGSVHNNRQELQGMVFYWGQST